MTVRQAARRLHRWVAWLFVAAVLGQIFLAGLAMFGAADSFALHDAFGSTVVGVVALAVLLVAVVGRLGSTGVGLSFLLLVLTVVQTMLPQARGSLPVVAALHPLNAVALVALGVRLARPGSGDTPRSGDTPPGGFD
ncbi:MAG: hypothetical protein KatS3mg065_0010 [Chloroflexota bacterium]|nr:MAG: hypothetical protein KatS3mg065_0010 [Chloroflexota bacterium]